MSSALVAIKSANLPKSAERPRPLGRGWTGANGEAVTSFTTVN